MSTNSFFLSSSKDFLNDSIAISLALDIGDLYWHDVDYPNDLDNAKLNINKIASKKTSTKLKIV